jgi:hypothetical protein
MRYKIEHKENCGRKKKPVLKAKDCWEKMLILLKSELVGPRIRREVIRTMDEERASGGTMEEEGSGGAMDEKRGGGAMDEKRSGRAIQEKRSGEAMR